MPEAVGVCLSGNFCWRGVERLEGLGYMMKVTSTVAYQAFTERNLTCRRLFWTMPWLIGIHGIPRRLLIDVDEFGLHLNDANRKYGSAPQGLQIRKPGNYDRGLS